MGVGMATGDNRVVQAVKKAISSPLLETSIEGAKGVILNVKGGNDLTLGQVYEAANLINSVIDSSATVIFGANIDPEYNEKFEITVIATGFTDKDEMPEEKKDEQRDNFKNYVNDDVAPERVDVVSPRANAATEEREKAYAPYNAPQRDANVLRSGRENAGFEENRRPAYAENRRDEYAGRRAEETPAKSAEEETEDEETKDFPSFMKKLFRKNK